MKEDFWEPSYPDAPHLSDQLLLPNLARGKNVYFLSAFAPSYLFRLLRDLQSSSEIEPGYLDITFFIVGDLDLKSEGIVRLRRFLREHADDQQVADFIDDSLELIAEGNVRISVAHSNSKMALTRSCLGVITDNSEDFVGFVDLKSGDFNSPVELYRSWKDEEFFQSKKIIDGINKVHAGKSGNLRVVSGSEMVSWLEYLHEWYQLNPPITIQGVTGSNSYPDNRSLESQDSELNDDEVILDFLSDFEELSNEESYEWDDGYLEEFDLSLFSDFGVVVDSKEAVGGHIPPLPEPVASFVGPASATCTCGNRFIRSQGCDKILW